MLREARNYVRIEGYLAEKDLKYGSKQVVNGGTTVVEKYIAGSVHVQLDQEFGGEKVKTDIPVFFYAKERKRDGGMNPSYLSIERVMNEYNSIASAGGIEGADKIRVTGAKLTMNEYFNKNNSFISFPRIRGSFVNLVTSDYNPEATFQTEIVVSSIQDVMDADGIPVEPRKLEITALLPQYGEKVDVMKFHAITPKVIDVIENNWEPNCTYNATGRLNFSSSTVEVIENQDFGEPIKRKKTTSVSELVVTGGSTSPHDEEFAFNMSDLNKAITERKARIEELRANPILSKVGRATPAKAQLTMDDLGF